MLGDAVRSMSDIAQVFRDRVHALGIAYATVDSIAGLADGYTAKCLSEPPQRAMGSKAMVLIAGALGIAFVPIVDHRQAALVKSRWTPRRRTSADNPAQQCVVAAERLVNAPRIKGSTLHVQRPQTSIRQV
jgi:hypothetical protein